MIRKLFTIAALLIFTSTVNAGPIEWAKHHKRFLLMEGAAVGSAIIGAQGLKACRSTGVEKCTAHYGAAWATFGVGTGLNFAMTGVAEGCWKNEGGKFCNIFAYGGSAVQAGWGIHEWRLKAPKDATQ
jgi:hypothetical protein